MTDENYDYHLHNLKKLHVDLEKQMLKFDEILPYERQKTSEIYSPRLLNMMLACCPQIEAITKWISHKCGFPEDPVPMMIKKINEKGVLSNFEIISIPHRLSFTPFAELLSWWHAYNEQKHELTEKQFELTYFEVMSAFAALTALHYLASYLNGDDNHVQEILDKDSWINGNWPKEMSETMRPNRDYGEYPIYKSLMFTVTTILKSE